MARGKTYRVLGWVLVALGVLWNIAGTLYGQVPRDVSIGFLVIAIGVSFLWRAQRMRRTLPGPPKQ